MGILAQGGQHKFNVGDRVIFAGREAVVVGLTVEPSDILQFDDGSLLTVGQSLVLSSAAAFMDPEPWQAHKTGGWRSATRHDPDATWYAPRSREQYEADQRSIESGSEA